MFRKFKRVKHTLNTLRKILEQFESQYVMAVGRFRIKISMFVRAGPLATIGTALLPIVIKAELILL